MAYKQKGFPQHISTINRSPAQGWDWWDENVQDQGYGGAALSGAATGAQIGSIVPGVGTAVGGIVGAVAGIGINAFKNNKSDEPAEKVDQMKYHRQERAALEAEAAARESPEEKQERWQKATDKRSYDKFLDANIEEVQLTRV